MSGVYHEGSRFWQDRFDTRRLADRIEERFVDDVIDDDDREFIERLDMFFLATADEHGHPQCSYKGGEPASSASWTSTRSRSPTSTATACTSRWGTPCAIRSVGLLFIDFERQKRMRLNGVASIDEHDPLLAEYPEAQFVVRVRATEVFPNCPRYIHKLQLVERSRFVPQGRLRDAGAGVEAPRVVARRARRGGDPARRRPLDRTASRLHLTQV